MCYMVLTLRLTSPSFSFLRCSSQTTFLFLSTLLACVEGDLFVYIYVYMCLRLTQGQRMRLEFVLCVFGCFSVFLFSNNVDSHCHY